MTDIEILSIAVVALSFIGVALFMVLCSLCASKFENLEFRILRAEKRLSGKSKVGGK